MLLLRIPHHNVPHGSLTVTVNKWLLELLTAAHSWQPTNRLPRMNRSYALHKLITCLHSKCYRPSGKWFIGKIRMPLAASAHRSPWSSEPRNGQASKRLPCVCVCVCVCVCTCIYIHTHTHTYRYLTFKPPVPLTATTPNHVYGAAVTESSEVIYSILRSSQIHSRVHKMLPTDRIH
jgi:hypothetical protein